MTALRVLHSEAATSFGGQERRIFKEMMAMREHGHYLEAVCQPDALLTRRLQDQGFIVHTLFMDGPVNFVKGVAKIRAQLRKGRFDVLNTHSRRDTLIAGCAARLAGTPLIVRTRHLANKAGSLLSYTVVPQRVTTVSDYVRRNLIEQGVDPDHVATIYSPIQLPPVIENSTLRQELKLADDAIVVGCVAVLRAQKGHRILIDAMEPIITARSDLHLVFVGGGSPLFEELQAYIGKKGLTEYVHLMGVRDDVPNLLAGFDLFALATEQEASGTVFVEAAAAGLAVIGTDVGGVSEMMQNGVTGILVPPGDRHALSAALQQLINDPERRCRMGRAGQKLFREEGKFSLDTLARHTESCYRRWLTELRP